MCQGPALIKAKATRIVDRRGMIKNEDANGYDRDWTVDALLSFWDDCAAVQIISETFQDHEWGARRRPKSTFYSSWD
jgi:hypothetical protein